MPRWDAKVDSTHGVIREAVRAAGYVWVDLFRVGQGIPDALTISKSGIIALLEVKSEDGELTKAERVFWSACNGPKMIVRTPEDALAFLAYLDEMRMEFTDTE